MAAVIPRVLITRVLSAPPVARSVSRLFSSPLLSTALRSSTPSSSVVSSSPAARCASTVSATAPPVALNPFHIAIPVHDLDAARKFYGGLLDCEEGRSAKTWIDWNLGGHQLVTHFVSKTYKGQAFVNDVDKDMVPVPHFGICLTVVQFKGLAARLKEANVKFIVEPHVRFEGKPGEQWTMFFQDPSGNSLEFKAMANPANLFAKYYVD